MAKKECEVEGCTKKAWLGKRCKEHYEEKNGKWTPVKKYRKKGEAQEPAKKAVTEGRITREKAAGLYSEEAKWGIPGDKTPPLINAEPVITKEQALRLRLLGEKGSVDIEGLNKLGPVEILIVLDWDVYVKLADRAKAEYRTIEQQTAYCIHRLLF